MNTDKYTVSYGSMWFDQPNGDCLEVASNNEARLYLVDDNVRVIEFSHVTHSIEYALLKLNTLKDKNK